MAIQKQIDAINLYAALMEEIKIRIGLTEMAIQGKLFIHSQLVREISYLQLRLICELIALGCLVVHGDIKTVREKRFMKEYDASKIITGLQVLHPNFYPLPIVTEFDFDSKGHHRTVPITSAFLTKQELITLCGKSGDHLHRGSIKKLMKPRNLNIPNSYPDIWEWLKKIGTLLSNHQIGLLGGKTHVLCILSATNLGGACQVAIADAAQPPPDAKALDALQRKP